MNQLSQIRSRINALRRKMALEISVVRLRPVADDFCYQWTEPAPKAGPPRIGVPSSEKWVKRDTGSPPSWPPTSTWRSASRTTSFPASSISWASCSPGPQSAVS